MLNNDCDDKPWTNEDWKALGRELFGMVIVASAIVGMALFLGAGVTP